MSAENNPLNNRGTTNPEIPQSTNLRREGGSPCNCEGGPYSTFSPHSKACPMYKPRDHKIVFPRNGW